MSNVLVKNIPFKDIFIRNKQAGYFLIKTVIAAALILFIIGKINFSEVLSGISAADFNLIILSFALSFMNLYLQFLKWETVCKEYLNISNKKKIWFSLFHGFAAGIFTPARIGEYFSRGLVFKEKSAFKIAGATFIDKLFPLLAVAFFGGISFIIYFYYYYRISFLMLSLLFVLITIIIYILMKKLTAGGFPEIIPGKIRRKKNLEKLIMNLEQLRKFDCNFVLRMILISSSFYFCYLIQFAILISAFSRNSNFIQYIWCGSLVMFTKSIIPQISFGELGIREGVSIYFLSKIGETPAAAFNASFFLFLINLVFPSLIGLILLYKKGND